MDSTTPAAPAPTTKQDDESRNTSSTTSLPILHPLTTIPENRTNTVPVPGTTISTPVHPARRAHTLRYPVYPDTPYSAGATAMPYVSTSSSRMRDGSTASSGPGSGAFFVWPSGIPRTLTSRRSGPNTNATTTPTSILPIASRPAPQQAAAPPKPIPTATAAPAYSPADTEITREFEHEARLLEKRRKADFPRRLLTALFGGAAVVAPMVIMSLHRSLIKSLVTSSVAMLVFGVTLAWTSAADEATLMAATAGYAAVLAVFVAVG